jgi:putative heme-binding domain-containing protein
LIAVLEEIPDDPLIWPQLLPAYRHSSNQNVGLALVRRLGELVKSDSFRPSEAELLKILQSYRGSVSEKGASLLTTLRERRAALGSRLEEYQSLGEGGDVDRGRKVFFDKEVACGACHRVAAQGGNVGPDLTTIGAVRSVRDLLESIVAPSSTFAQGYENYVVLMSDGRVASGLIVRQSAETLLLQSASGQEQRFHEDHIEELTRQSTSIMPDGLDQKLTRAQLRDLLAYLKSLK